MRRLFLAAGVAALAIATPALAGPGGHGGGGNPHGGGGGGGPHGGGGGPPAFAGGGGHGHGGGGGGAPAFMGGGGGRGHGGGGGFAPMMARGPGGGGGGHGHGGGGFAPMYAQGHGGGAGRDHGGGHQQAQAFAGGGGHGRGGGSAHMQARAFAGGGSHGHGNGGAAAHQRGQAFAGNGGRVHGGQQVAHGTGRQQVQMTQRQQIRGNADMRVQQQAFANGRGNGHAALVAGGAAALGGAALVNGHMNGRLANPQFVQQNWDASRYPVLSYGNDVSVLPVTQVEQFVGQPISVVSPYAALSPLPATLQYLYPATPDYYYQYGGGYLYQVDRTDNLIASMISLLAGGYLPGQYLPAAYMQSYVPSYYGFNSFYPASYGYGGYADYGYNGNVCNRYYYGVIYQVDCYSGMVQNVIPLYAGGYGVGQMIPSAYSYYNVPVQYRSVYYNTPDYNYWYGPGAIYQYDPRSSMITSVAALLSPGFTVGQQLPMGYDVYNVPYAYRATYYDSPTAWYRYNNGYIYQVDPTTMLVTAVVASLLNS